MKKENSSSLKKLEMLFSKISETQERYIVIDFMKCEGTKKSL